MKITSRSTPVAIAALLVASSGAAQAQSVFSDVPDNHWAAAAVKTLAEAGIIEGYAASDTRRSSRDRRVVVNQAKAHAIAGKVLHALRQEERLDAKDISVTGSSEDTTITLTGRVYSKSDRDWAGQIAASNASEFRIVNRLRVTAKSNGR